MINNNLERYLFDIATKLKLNLLIGLMAFIIFVLWYACDINKYFSFSHLHISLGHIGYIGLLFIPSFFVIDKNNLQKLWIFFSVLALLDLPNLLYITNNKPIDNSLFFSSTTLVILMLLFLLIMLLSTSKSVISSKINTNWKNLVIVAFSSLFTILIYHSVNIINRSIPNDERSIFVNGLEFHHINYGIILLILTPFLFKYIPRVTSKLYNTLGYIFIGFIYGTVFDEAYYYMLQDVSDDNYFDIPITLASIMIMIFSFFIWFFYLKKESNNVT